MSRVNGKTKNRVKGPHKELGERTNSRLKGQTKSNGHPQPFLAVNLHLSLPWWSTSSHLYPLVVFKKGVGWRGEKRRVMKEGRWNKEGYNLQLTSKQNRVKGKTLYKERINQTVAKKDARPTTKNVTRLDPDLLVGSSSITPGLGTAFFSVRYC